MRTLFNDDWYFKKLVLETDTSGKAGGLIVPKDKKIFSPDDFYEQCTAIDTCKKVEAEERNGNQNHRKYHAG